MTLDEVAKQHILSVLDANSNKTEAAKILGISLKTLYNKLHQYGVFHEYRKGYNDTYTTAENQRTSETTRYREKTY